MKQFLVVAAWLAACSATAQADDRPHNGAPPSISVTGEGIATAEPDIAIITSGVVTSGQTAGAALKANAAAMTKLLSAVKAAGVADRDVGTSGLSVQPQYDYGAGGTGKPPRLTGYEARNSVTLRARDVGKLGELIDQLVAAGSNQVEDLAFDVSEREAKLDEARRAAAKDARRKGELFAQGAGVKLGRLLALQEGAAEAPRPEPLAGRMKAMAADAPSTPIARGEQELRAKVTARFEIEP